MSSKFPKNVAKLKRDVEISKALKLNDDYSPSNRHDALLNVLPSGSQYHLTLAELTALAKAILKDGTVAMEADLDIGGNDLLNVASITDTNNHTILTLDPSATTPTKNIKITNADVFSTPAILPTGSDTNISIRIASKGAGNVQLDPGTGYIDADSHQIKNVTDPDEMYDAVNLHSVLDLLDSVAEYTFTDDDDSSYKVLQDNYVTGDVVEYFGEYASGDTLIKAWRSESGVPGVTGISAGDRAISIHAYKSGTKTARLYWKIYKYAADTTKTLLSTSSYSSDLTTSPLHYDFTAYIEAQSFLVTDRFTVELFVEVSDVGSDPTVYIQILGTTGAKYRTPTQSPTQNLANYMRIDISNTIGDSCAIIPTTTNTNSLGSSSKTFKDIYTRILQSDSELHLISSTSLINANASKITHLADGTVGTDAVNLHQLLEAIPVSTKWYLSNSASADLSGYKLLSSTNDGSTNTITVTIDSATKAVEEWATAANSPGYTVLKAGEYKFHVYAKQTSTTGYKGIQLYAQLYYCAADGSSEVQVNSDSTHTATLTTDSVDYNVDIHLDADITITATQRLKLKVIAIQVGSGNNPELVMSIGSTTDSYLAEPVSSALANNFANKIKAMTTATAAATAAKEITIANYSMTLGDLIAVTFTNGNTVASATLNINSTGAVAIYSNAAAVNTTNFTLTANAIVLFYYDGTYWQMLGSQRISDSNDYDRIRLTQATHVVGTTVYRYKICMEGSDSKLYPFTLEDSTGATKTISTQTFRINGLITWYTSTTTLTVGQTSTSFYQSLPTTTLAYTANGSGIFTVQLPIYLVGSIDANGYFVLDNSSYTSFLTQTLPSTDDEKVYILLGYYYSTDDMYLLPHHPIYEYKNGAVRQYIPSIIETAAITEDLATKCPSSQLVFDGLALKANDADVVHDTSDETIAGTKTFSSNIQIGTNNKGLYIKRASDGLYEPVLLLTSSDNTYIQAPTGKDIIFYPNHGGSGINIRFDTNGRLKYLVDPIDAQDAATYNILLTAIKYVQPFQYGPTNGFTFVDYTNASYSVVDSDNDAAMNAKFIIPISGSYKLLIVHSNSANSITNSGLVYMGEAGDGETRNNTSLVNGGNLDLVNDATAGKYKYTYSSAYSLTAGKIIAAQWKKDAAEAGNTLYIHLMCLVRQ